MSTVSNWRGPNIIKDNLILYLNPNSPNSYNQIISPSNLWRDISEYQQSSILFNNPILNDTNNIKSLVFDGINDYALGNTNLPQLSTEITIICVAKIPNMNSRVPLFSKYQTIAPFGFAFEVGTVSSLWIRTMRFYCQNSGVPALDYRGTTQLNSNQIYMFSVTFKQGTSIKMYYNLTEMTANHANVNWASVTGWATGTNKYYSGAYQPAVGVYGNSYIYMLNVYNKAFTLDELTSFYNSIKDIYNI